MKTFVDNVCRQVIERHIIAKLPIVFEPVLVSGYETEELLRMAAESARVSIRREEARHFQEVLEQSLEDPSILPCRPRSPPISYAAGLPLEGAGLMTG